MKLNIIVVISAIIAVAGAELNVPSIVGSYELIRSENFNEYMIAIGVGFLTRQLAAHATPTTVVTNNNDHWDFKTSTTFTSSEVNFELGVPFQETTADGRSCLSTITAAGNNIFNHVQKNCGGGPEGLLITREFTGTELRMVLTAPGDNGQQIVCTRVYKKL